jgi:hypothetical protein
MIEGVVDTATASEWIVAALDVDGVGALDAPV